MSKPYRDRLQLDKPCCACGKTLKEGTVAALLVAPVEFEHVVTNVLIAWCDTCWRLRHMGDIALAPDAAEAMGLALIKSAADARAKLALGTTMTYAEVERACANVGIDLQCAACAELFFTGSTTHKHEAKCGRRNQ